MTKTRSPVDLIGKNAYTPLVQGGTESLGAFLDSTDFQKDELNMPDPGQAVWCVDFPVTVDEWRRLFRVKKTNRTLIRYEPSVVLPQTHSSIFTGLFGLVIDIGRPLGMHAHCVKWPQTWSTISDIREGHRSSRVVVINANKMSLIKGEQYSLRRKCMHSIESIDFYGLDWDLPVTLKSKKLIGELVICLAAFRVPALSASALWFKRSKNYLGTTPDKRQTLEKYRVSLVIENSPEFLTEKLFDSLFAGTIPVYVGPQLTDYNIPTSIAIQAEASLEGVRDGISRALALDYATWNRTASSWLQESDVVSEWSAKAVYQEIAATAIARNAT